MLAAICATCSGEWVRAFFAYGTSRSVGHSSIRRAMAGLSAVDMLIWLVDRFEPSNFDHSSVRRLFFEAPRAVLRLFLDPSHQHATVVSGRDPIAPVHTKRQASGGILGRPA